MKILKVITPWNCFNGACPCFRVTAGGDVLVQGAKLLPDERELLPVPGHEDVIRIPQAVFDDLLNQYRNPGEEKRPGF